MERLNCAEESVAMPSTMPETRIEKPLNLSWTAKVSSTVDINVPYHGLLTYAEKDDFGEHVGRQYLRRLQDDIVQLWATLNEKSWFVFGHDDTLHEFRRASGTATDKCPRGNFSTKWSGLDVLKEGHHKFLEEKTAGAFSDGKTTFDYRRERFTAFLDHRMHRRGLYKPLASTHTLIFWQLRTISELQRSMDSLPKC
jgi:hypothetical protein